MNSNRLFSKGMRADFRREAAWLTMYGLLFLFLIPVGYLFGISSSHYREVAEEIQRHQSLFNYAIRMTGMGAPTILLMGAGFLEAYHEFGYLHRRREIDFYHALPGTRRQLFFSRFINGLITVLVPYLSAVVIGLICSVLTGLGVKEMLSPVCAAVLLNGIIFLLIYSTAILAVMLTGRALTGILGMFILNGYFPLLSLLLTEIPSAWYRTYQSTGSSPFLTFLSELSPVTQTIRYMSVFDERFTMPFHYGALTAGFIFRVLAGFAAAMAIMLISLKLYDLRQLEKAGEAMAFRGTEPVIRILLVFFAAVGTMQFMKAIGSEIGWILFFTLAAVVIGHMIIELIYRADPKRVFRHKTELGAMVLIAAAFVLCVHFDVTGYDRYLPEENEIETAELHFYTFSNVYSLWEVDSSGEITCSYTESPEFWQDEDTDAAFRGTYTGSPEIAAVRSVAQKGIDYNKAIIQKTAAAGKTRKEAVPGEDDNNSVYVVWHLKNGKAVSRRYNVPVREMHDEYAVLFDSEEGREYMFPLLASGMKEKIGSVRYEENNTAVRLPDKDSEKRILDAYLMDLRAMTMAEIEGKAPAALLQLGATPELLQLFGLDNRAEELESAARVDFQFGGELFFRYPVYESFSNTLSALESAGVRPGILKESLARVDAFSCGGWGMDRNGDESWFSGMADQAEDVEIIRNYLVLYAYSYYNMYGPETIGDLEITWSEAGREYSGALLRNDETEALADRLFREHFLTRKGRSDDR